MRIAICDDEPLFRELLRDKIVMVRLPKEGSTPEINAKRGDV